MKKRNIVECGYVSPEMRVVEIDSEGLLCQSGSFEDWYEDELEWDWNIV